MTIIADSGSTKTTWIDVATGNKMVTEGLNPHFTTDAQFLTVGKKVVKFFHLSPFSLHLVFYGAGCGNTAQQERVQWLLTQGLCVDKLQVETDMLGACRAVSGDKPSLVGILGTGSNACYYDGKKIEYSSISTGYILGDDGSANHVGRRLLQDYLSGVMPSTLIDRFHDAYPMTQEEFIDAVYHQPNANRFLASLARFAVEHINDDYCSSEIIVSLYDWYNYQLDSLRKLSRCDTLNIVGGFAYRIKPLIEIIARDKGLTIRKIVADPIEGLREYHLKHNTI